MQELGAVLSTPQKQQQLGGSQPPDVSSAAGMPPSLRTLAAVDASAGLPFGAAADGTAAIAAAASGGEQDSGFPSLAAGPAQQQQQQQLAFYAFPTLQQLSAATEEALRADGFGYRCAPNTTIPLPQVAQLAGSRFHCDNHWQCVHFAV
jgi:hypothetical protein